MLSTPFTDLVGCTVPLQLAAMGGGVTTPELVGAVCRAGGLGMMQRGGTRPLRERLDELAEAGAAPFGVNFVPPLGQIDALDDVRLAASRARLVEFFYADPDHELVALVHDAGALAAWQVGSVDEARRAAEVGCDVVVLQGVEAGGHVRGSTALFPMLAAVVEAIDVPVVAAGGIATGRSMAAALAAGASAVRVGTRFLAAAESGAHPDYVAAILAAGEDDTVLTTAFAVGWPDAPHRVLASALTAAEAFTGDVVATLETPSGPQPLPRLSARTPSREVTGTVAAMAMYAGEGVGDVREVAPAAAIVDDLAETAEVLLRRW